MWAPGMQDCEQQLLDKSCRGMASSAQTSESWPGDSAPDVESSPDCAASSGVTQAHADGGAAVPDAPEPKQWAINVADSRKLDSFEANLRRSALSCTLRDTHPACQASRRAGYQQIPLFLQVEWERGPCRAVPEWQGGDHAARAV